MTLRLARPKPGYGESYGTSYGTSDDTARIYVSTAPDHGATDYALEHDDILHINAGSKANKPATKGTITLDNDEYARSLSDQCPDVDDKLVGLVAVASDDRAAGAGPAGAGPAGGWRRIGDFIVADREIDPLGPDSSEIILEVKDYVYDILGERRVFAYSRSNKPISGTEDAHLNWILRHNAEQINRSNLPTLDVRVDYSAHGKHLKDVVDELAGMVGHHYGGVITYSQTDRLIVRALRPRDVTPKYPEPITLADLQGDISAARERHDMTNYLRLDGAIDVDNVGDSQETVDHIVEADDTNRLQVQVDIPKPQIPRIEVYTNGDGSSGDGLRVRLQRDIGDNTGPIAPGDPERDLATSEVRTSVGLSLDDWTTYDLEEHDAFERDPWIIIDSPGPDGYGVGVDANGTPAYRAHFAKPVVAELGDGSSLNEYLQHDGHVRDRAILTAGAARDRIQSILGWKALPPDYVSGEAHTDRAHSLSVGDVVDLDMPKLQVEGTAVVTERTVTYDGMTLDTDLAFVGL